MKNTIERWDKFEIELKCKDVKNPFANISLQAVFSHKEKDVKVDGFYDGANTFRIRFMPDLLGKWTYKVISNREEMDGAEGGFACVEQNENNHGFVTVKHQHHFAYRDGTPYYPFGTTSYGWAHQRDKLANETIDSLAKSPFNKIRMCVIPHYSEFSSRNIKHYPFEGEPLKNWDFSKLCPEYFRTIEQRVERLMERGIEADLILFHPYANEWGFGSMPHEADKAYLRYVVSRFAAYRNVWWSLANEYDMMAAKTVDEWHDLCKTVWEADPYGHLLSIHNYQRLYEYWQPWITHATIQDGLAVSREGRAVILVKAYHKPVIYDEVCYEGNFDLRWGNLSAEEFVSRCWNAMVSGAYVGHGEVIREEGENGDMVWTGIGGKLKGDSIERMAFLRKIIEEGPGHGWEAVDKWWHTGMAKKGDGEFLIYFGEKIQDTWRFEIPSKDMILASGTGYKAEIIDTWNMTMETVDDTFVIDKGEQYSYKDIHGKSIKLPNKKYIALRIFSK